MSELSCHRPLYAPGAITLFLLALVGSPGSGWPEETGETCSMQLHNWELRVESADNLSQNQDCDDDVELDPPLKTTAWVGQNLPFPPHRARYKLEIDDRRLEMATSEYIVVFGLYDPFGGTVVDIALDGAGKLWAQMNGVPGAHALGDIGRKGSTLDIEWERAIGLQTAWIRVLRNGLLVLEIGLPSAAEPPAQVRFGVIDGSPGMGRGFFTFRPISAVLQWEPESH